MSSEEVKSILKSKKLKATSQRIQLLCYLADQVTPLSLSEMANDVQNDLDESTIFRNLEAFEKARLVTRYLIESGVTHYELSLDGTSHHHVVCTNCNVIEELIECPIQNMQQILNQTHLFQNISSHQLCFYGICHNCATNSSF